MPDGYAPSSSAALGSIGAGLLDTYFPALKQERDKADADKKYEKELQMRALHDLIASGNTTVGDVPRLMKMHADLAGIGKLPGVQEIITNMEQAAQRQVPQGEERQTAQSRVAGMEAQAGSRPSTTPLVTSVAMRSVPPEPVTVQPGAPGQPTKTIASPVTYQTDPNAPTSITTPALKVVPPEPVMYQPTQTAGSLTQDQLKDIREAQTYDARQESMLKRQSELAEAAGDRQAQREADRQLAQINQIRTRAEEARKTQDALFADKIKMLDPETQAKAKLRVAQIETALTAQNQNPNVSQEEIHRQAGQMAVAEITVGTAAKQAQIEKSKAAIQHWRAIDARALVAKGGAATQGMSAGQARIFRVNTLDILPDLNATRTQLQKLQTDLALLGGKDPAIEGRIKELQGQQDGLLLRLKEERDKILAPTQSAPSVPGTTAPQSRTNSTYNVPLSKYGLQ